MDGTRKDIDGELADVGQPALDPLEVGDHRREQLERRHGTDAKRDDEAEEAGLDGEAEESEARSETFPADRQAEATDQVVTAESSVEAPPADQQAAEGCPVQVHSPKSRIR